MKRQKGARRGLKKPRVTQWVNADGQVRGLLRCDGERSLLVFYDEGGGAREVVRGLLSVSTVLWQMLNDSGFHPDIIGSNVFRGVSVGGESQVCH